MLMSNRVGKTRKKASNPMTILTFQLMTEVERLADTRVPVDHPTYGPKFGLRCSTRIGRGSLRNGRPNANLTKQIGGEILY